MNHVAGVPSRVSIALRSLGRMLSGLPDALTAAAYAFTWLFPLAYHVDAVKVLMVVMMLEFLVVHSGAFIGMVVLAPGTSRTTKSLAILGLGALYLVFAGGFALAVQAWWPVLSFGWLLLAKFAQVWLVPEPAEHEVKRQQGLWAISVVCYLGAVFLTIPDWIPELGITEQVRSVIALPGSGLWIERPQTVIASGMVYFALLAVSKWGYREP